MRKILKLSRVVSIVALVSIGLNVYLYSQVDKHRRAYNRPYISSFLLGLLNFDSSRQIQAVDLKKEMLFRSLLLNHLNSAFCEPLQPEIETGAVQVLMQTCDEDQIKLMFDSIFNGVDEIIKHNAIFVSEGQTRIAVIGDTRYVTRDYQGDECEDVVKDIRIDFFEYLYSFPTDS